MFSEYDLLDAVTDLLYIRHPVLQLLRKHFTNLGFTDKHVCLLFIYSLTHSLFHSFKIRQFTMIFPIRWCLVHSLLNSFCLLLLFPQSRISVLVNLLVLRIDIGRSMLNDSPYPTERKKTRKYWMMTISLNPRDLKMVHRRKHPLQRRLYQREE